MGCATIEFNLIMCTFKVGILARKKYRARIIHSKQRLVQAFVV
jgi:hypothetical protein